MRRRNGLAPHLRLGVEVTEARYDEGAARWEVRTSSGEVLRARVLVAACGQLSRPALPRLPGLERFQGRAFHSARWDLDAALDGRAVAVIGTGASAIRLVPELAARAARLTVFQRSAPYVIPKPDRAYRPWERALLRRVPALLRLSRAVTYLRHEVRVLAFAFAPALMRLYARRFRRRLAREIPDPALRARLTPDHPMGCKRILLSNDWYPALRRPGVAVVDAPIREVTARGIVTADGVEHPSDVIVFGTGFHATELLAPMRVAGLGGRTLEEAWRGGAEAHLGLQVAGFPNLFLLYGPNTNLGHSSILLMLESQIRYVLGALRLLRDRRLRALDVRPEVQRASVARVQRALERSIWAGGCTSWYRTAAGRNTQNWPGFTFGYRLRTRRPRLAHQRVDLR